MRHLILASLLFLPAVALADDAQCRFHADRNLDLDFSGIHSVRFTVNAYDLHVDGNASAGRGTIRGKACASDQETLDNLVVTQERRGDTLVVELKDQREHGWSGHGSRYSDLKVEASIPSSIPVMLEVGSGDAKIRGVASLETGGGSGDVEVRDVKGAVNGRLGSGELTTDGTGPIRIASVGSGSFEARHVTGDVRVDSVGSGSAKIGDVSGNVDIGSVASGELKVQNVRGSLSVRSKGSGDVTFDGIGGKVDIPDRRR